MSLCFHWPASQSLTRTRSHSLPRLLLGPPCLLALFLGPKFHFKKTSTMELTLFVIVIKMCTKCFNNKLSWKICGEKVNHDFKSYIFGNLKLKNETLETAAW